MRKIADAGVRRRTAEARETVRLPHAAKRYSRELSGRSSSVPRSHVVYRPAIILMNEPLGALDKMLRDQMQLEIKRTHRELRTTMIYATHDQEEAMTMSDRICLMNAGAINLPFSEWSQVISNPRLCKAVIDRLIDRAHIISTGTFRRTTRPQNQEQEREKNR